MVTGTLTTTPASRRGLASPIQVRGELLPALDWETDPPAAAWALRFLEALETAIGTPPILYTFPDFLRRTGHFDDFHRFPLWYSRFGPNDGWVHPANPPHGFRFVVHQFTSAGRVNGIDGQADLNVLEFGSLRPLVVGRVAASGEELPAAGKAELPPSPEGEGFAGRTLDTGDRERLEAEDFDPVPE